MMSYKNSGGEEKKEAEVVPENPSRPPSRGSRGVKKCHFFGPFLEALLDTLPKIFPNFGEKCPTSAFKN